MEELGNQKECEKKIYDVVFCVKVCALAEGKRLYKVVVGTLPQGYYRHNFPSFCYNIDISYESLSGEKCKTSLNPGDDMCDMDLECIEGICTSIDMELDETADDDYYDEYEDEESAEVTVLF